MNCRELDAWLQQRLDGADTPRPAEVAQHLAECAECRALEEAAGRLLLGLAKLPKVEPAPLLTQTIVTAVLEDRRRRQGLARRRIAITLALAASILLLMLAGWLLIPPGPGKNQNAGNHPAPGPHVPEVPKLAERADEARVAVASLTERVADQTKEQAKLLMSVANSIDFSPMAGLPDLSQLEPPLDPAAQSLRSATESVADGLEPITASARRAFQFFSKEMPMFEIPQGN